MPDLPLVRYFCSVTTARNPDKDTWGDVGFDYFEAIKRRFGKVRVFADGLMHQAILARSSRWHPYSEAFGTPVELPYLNVVCGPEAQLRRYWTAKVPNIAITSQNGVLVDELSTLNQKKWDEATQNGKDPLGQPYGAKEEIEGIHQKYDLVACLSADDVVALGKTGVVAKHLQPDDLADVLAEVFAAYS